MGRCLKTVYAQLQTDTDSSLLTSLLVLNGYCPLKVIILYLVTTVVTHTGLELKVRKHQQDSVSPLSSILPADPQGAAASWATMVQELGNKAPFPCKCLLK